MGRKQCLEELKEMISECLKEAVAFSESSDGDWSPRLELMVALRQVNQMLEDEQ